MILFYLTKENADLKVVAMLFLKGKVCKCLHKINLSSISSWTVSCIPKGSLSFSTLLNRGEANRTLGR